MTLHHVHRNRFPRFVHKTMQHPLLSSLSRLSNAARVAASNTSSTPSPVRDEHSRYLRAPTSCAMSLPSLGVVNCRDFLRISSCAAGSPRRSFFSPTSRIGTPGHRSCASSTHCSQLAGRRDGSNIWKLSDLVFHVVQRVWCVN